MCEIQPGGPYWRVTAMEREVIQEGLAMISIRYLCFVYVTGNRRASLIISSCIASAVVDLLNQPQIKILHVELETGIPVINRAASLWILKRLSLLVFVIPEHLRAEYQSMKPC